MQNRKRVLQRITPRNGNHETDRLRRLLFLRISHHRLRMDRIYRSCSEAIPTNRRIQSSKTIQNGCLAWSRNRGSDPSIGWPELLQHSRVILLAPAGAGKTEEMKAQEGSPCQEKVTSPSTFLSRTLAWGRPVEKVLSPVEEEENFAQWKECTRQCDSLVLSRCSG